MMRTRLTGIAAASLLAFGLAACSDSDEINAATGAIIGAGVGNQIGDGRGRVLATAVGAGVGAQVGATANDRNNR